MSTTITTNREAFVQYVVAEREKGTNPWNIYSYVKETFGYEETDIICAEADVIVKTPVVGKGATICWWSDSHAGTIIWVSDNGKRIIVQRDIATRTDGNGLSESQKYTYERDPQGITYEFSLRKNGRWVRVGDSVKDGLKCSVGLRNEYFDFSF